MVYPRKATQNTLIMLSKLLDETNYFQNKIAFNLPGCLSAYLRLQWLASQALIIVQTLNI